METADPFAEQPAGETAPPTADPFADTPDAVDEVAAEPTADIPVVDREGVPATPAPPALDEAAAAAGAPPAAAPPADPPAAAPAPPQEPPAAPPVAQEPPPAPAAPAAPPVTPPAAAPAAADPPAPASDGKKSTMRHYKVFRLVGTKEGVKSWDEFDLSTVAPEAQSGVSVVKDADGEPWMEARNNEHAVKLAFAVLGRPTDGVTVLPIPKGAYKTKHVAPATPRPERERLSIS